MKKYIKTVTIETKLTDPGFQGVSFTLRRFSHGIRTRLRMELAPALHQIREVTERIQLEVDRNNLGEPETPDASLELQGAKMLDPNPEDTPAATTSTVRKFTDEQIHAIDRMNDLAREIDIINAIHVDPVYLKYGLVSVNGITDDNDKPFTPNSLYDEGPEELCQEIVAAIKELSGVAPRSDRANLESPTTFGAAEGGQMSDTIAPSANEITGT